jgi:hypothetical protein
MEKKLMIKEVGKEKKFDQTSLIASNSISEMSHSSFKTKLVQLWGIGHSS